ncbi:MAG TPA: transglutaminase-like domain-containing protein [Gemmatimonadaceae bacterium]|nr:transglutaminase-like domain-containing protein [Gemmatimonadaceae bacterium]
MAPRLLQPVAGLRHTHRSRVRARAGVISRALLGGIVVVAWLAGLVLLVQREYFRPRAERLAAAAARVAPGAVFYGVMQGRRQVGFASSTVDTTQLSITLNDYFVADLPIGGKPRRATARTSATLSRALRLTSFDLSIESEGAPISATGTVESDTALVLTITSGTDKPEIRRVPLTGSLLLPTLVPMVVALVEQPKVGKRYVLPVFDPASMAPKDVAFNIRAESLFVLADSAVFDSTGRRWHGVRPDTVRGWNVVSETPGAFTGWIDDQGRILRTTQLGFRLERLPYEVAFENWRNDTTRLSVTDDRDILETTAIAANKRLNRRVDALVVRLRDVDLSGYDLDGQRQHLIGDTLIVRPGRAEALVADYKLPGGRQRDPEHTRAEALIQSNDPRIVQLAWRIAGDRKRDPSVRDPRVVAERINTWVHDSIRDRVTFGVPSALQVLQTRTGDCNEHTQLFVALARAVGLPARIAAGLAFVDGKFYYHAWPEVLLNDWVAVDPTFGQFPADAAHLRFIVGGLARQTELLRLMGNLKIDVLSVNEAVRPSEGQR